MRPARPRGLGVRELARSFVRECHRACLKAALVTIGGVHVPQLVVRRDRAAAGADRNERAVVALLPCRQPLELTERVAAEIVLAPVDVADRLQRLTGKSW